MKRFSTISLFLGCLPFYASATTITFSDTDFIQANWGALEIQDTSAGGQSFFSVQQISAGGNPGSFREVTHTFGFGTPGMSMRVAHVKDGAIYDPTVNGMIQSIDFAFDLDWLNPPLPTNAVGYEPLILQNGTYYRGPYSVIQSNQWLNFSLIDLVSTDFVSVLGSGSINPDFSNSASSLQFGYISQDGTFSSNTYTSISGLDNWNVTVTSPTDAPAPSTLVLLLSSILLVPLKKVAKFVGAEKSRKGATLN